ncbi:XRE family transcriptional regulator [Burkholderia ubonensis]|uniref:helix-turn-helix domain-containing protein n=1 Tax=Burkholderia ubonensis TaxID=101571 RepID=UPI00075476D1|nr:helix-turn-helix transcriptional regulator [Burkholderia ubonensis]KVD73287.1 XRE family transcriptional regulator [Burkholderia ubonensis]
MKTTSSAQRHLTPQEIEVELGERLKKLRVHRNLVQATLAARAGISVRTLRNLEGGSGSSLSTLIQVVRALGREQWFDTIAPVPTINPLMLTRTAAPRKRASKPRVNKPREVG